jgi:hypothetical protein
MTDWTHLRAILLKERGPLCECGCGQKWTDCHHMLIHRMAGRSFLDCRENIMVLFHDCHMSGKKINGYKAQQSFWERQCARYGEEHMQNWLDRLPLKVKPKFSSPASVWPPGTEGE